MLPQRILSRLTTDPVTGCWLWTGFIDPKGYGITNLDGKRRRVHRLTYAEFRGPIPDGHDLHHTEGCPHRHCANPFHVTPLTKQAHGAEHGPAGAVVGTPRSKGVSRPSRRKAECNHGHQMSEDNIYTRPTGERECRTCRADRRV